MSGNLSNDELMHYGVIGMKWGIRRGRIAQSYTKAVAKRDKLNKKVEVRKNQARKATIKANTGASAKYKKLQTKADEYQRKADKKKYGFFSNQKKAAKFQIKADRTQFKANKYKAKAERREMESGKANVRYIRAQLKAEKWIKSMDKAFKGKDLTQTSEKHKNSGRIYIEKKIS